MPESVSFTKDGLKQEISFIWNVTDENPKQVNQKIELFSPVNVKLTKHDNDPLKTNVNIQLVLVKLHIYEILRNLLFA